MLHKALGLKKQPSSTPKTDSFGKDSPPPRPPQQREPFARHKNKLIWKNGRVTDGLWWYGLFVDVVAYNRPPSEAKEGYKNDSWVREPRHASRLCLCPQQRSQTNVLVGPKSRGVRGINSILKLYSAICCIRFWGQGRTRIKFGVDQYQKLHINAILYTIQCNFARNSFCQYM